MYKFQSCPSRRKTRTELGEALIPRRHNQHALQNPTNSLGSLSCMRFLHYQKSEVRASPPAGPPAPSRDRDRQHVTLGRPELDNVSAVVFQAIDHNALLSPSFAPCPNPPRPRASPPEQLGS